MAQDAALILSDRSLRGMLEAFPEDYFAAHNSVAKVHMLASLGMQLLTLIFIGVATDGAGAAAQELGEGAVAFTASGAFATLIQALREAVAVLEKIPLARALDALAGQRIDTVVEDEAGAVVGTAARGVEEDQSASLPTEKATGPLSSTKANRPHIEKGNRPPYSEDKPVRDIVLQNERLFARVHGEANKAGAWLMRPGEIEGLSARQIKDKFALPELPTAVSDVRASAGTSIRLGTAAEQSGWGSGGGMQYELLDRLPSSAFQNTRALP